MTSIAKKNAKLAVLREEVRAFRKMLKKKYPKEFQECGEFSGLDLELSEFIAYGPWEYDEDDN